MIEYINAVRFYVLVKSQPPVPLAQQGWRGLSCALLGGDAQIIAIKFNQVKGVKKKRLEIVDRRNHIVARIEAKKNALNALLDQAQVSGLNDGLRFQIKRTRQDIRDAKAVLTKLDARNARSLKNKTEQTTGSL